MKKLYFYLLLIFSLQPVNAISGTATEAPTGQAVTILMSVIKQSVKEAQLAAELSRIPDSKPEIQDGQYQGQKLFFQGRLYALVRVQYQNQLPVVAGIISPPLRIRDATRRYNEYRNTLARDYKEISHNRYDIGDGIVAHITKKQRQVSIVISKP